MSEVLGGADTETPDDAELFLAGRGGIPILSWPFPDVRAKNQQMRTKWE